MSQQLLIAEDAALPALLVVAPCSLTIPWCCERVQFQQVPGQRFYTTGFVAVLRSSFKNDRMKIPTIYVTLSNVSAVAKPVLSMR
jgi:hypothetical protein